MKVKKCLSLFILASTGGTAAPDSPLSPHECVHSSSPKAARGLSSKSSQNYINHPFDDNEKPKSRSLREAENDEGSYSNIRIKAHFIDEKIHLTEEKSTFLKSKLVPDAISTWSEKLQVVPVVGNLYANRFCTAQYNTFPPTCHAVEQNQMCLEAEIPTEHFAPTKVCSSCPGNADEACTGGSCEVLPGTGVADADFTIYVQAQNTQYCTSSVLAYASTCQTDQHDRPTFGFVNFCPSKVSTDDYDKLLHTALHEFSHALGFSSDMYAYMRREDGTPRTERDSNGEPHRIESYTCPNGQVVANFAIPSEETIASFTERGHSVSKLVTPNVLAYVQAHFDCSELNGAELENQEGSPGACYGSHWEERIFEPEFMTAVQSEANVVSGLTLAFFEDSGWYKANFTTSEQMYYGANAGCEFALDTCITAEGEARDADHFCTGTENLGCSSDGSSKAMCTYSSNVGSEIPSVYQYFASPFAGGSKYADYCPILQSFDSGSCADPANLFRPPGTDLNLLGESFSASAMCTKSTLHATSGSQWSLATTGAGCYEMSCDASTGLLSIDVATSMTSKTTVTCDQKGQELTVPGFTGSLFCPDPYLVCRSGKCEQDCGANSLCLNGQCTCISGFVPKTDGTSGCESACPKACSRNGYCTPTTGECTCNSGWGGLDCATEVKVSSATNVVSSTSAASRKSEADAGVLLLMVGTVLPYLVL